MEAGAAIKFRIDDRAIPRPHSRARAGFHNFADHFVAHDARITYRNGAAVDLVIGAANSAIRHPHEHLAVAYGRARNFAQCQFVRRAQDHCLHFHCLAGVERLAVSALSF